VSEKRKEKKRKEKKGKEKKRKEGELGDKEVTRKTHLYRVSRPIQMCSPHLCWRACTGSILGTYEGYDPVQMSIFHQWIVHNYIRP
jgi:hypothetical protein